MFWLLIWLYILLISWVPQCLTMWGVIQHLWSNYICLSSSKTVYYVIVYLYIHIWFCFFFYFYLFVFANYHWAYILLFISLSCLLNSFYFASEYTSVYKGEVNAIYSSYVSVMSLSGLKIVHPYLVLVMSCVELSVLLLIALSSSVIVMQSSFLSHLGLAFLVYSLGGVVFLYINYGASYPVL